MPTLTIVLLQRLLKMFPVKVLREQFDVKGNAQGPMIEEILENNTTNTIHNFCFDNIDYTKQHVYLFQLNKRFNIRTFDDDEFPFRIIESTKSATEITLFCLPIITHSATAVNPYSTSDIKFYQPIKVKIQGDIVRIHFTILEKNIASYITNGEFVTSKRDLEEEDLKGTILEYLGENYDVDVYDINKGVKQLWDDDVIDSKYVKFKKASSTSTEAMDEGKTVKKNLPVEYRNLMNAPLQKTIIKYLPDNDDLCDVFTVDPTKGEISFTKYPKTKNQIENVVNEIISNN